MAQKYIITLEHVNKRIAELEAKRAEFIKQADLQIVSLSSKIEALKQIIAPDEKVADPHEDTLEIEANIEE